MNDKKITEIWLNYLEESKINPSLMPEDYVKRYPEYVKDLAALLAFTKIGQEVLKTDLTPLVNKMKNSVWAKVQANLAENKNQILIKVKNLLEEVNKLTKQKQFTKAFKVAEAGLKLQPNNLGLLIQKCIILEAQKKYKLAFETLQKFQQFSPPLNNDIMIASWYQILGWGFIQIGDYKSAEESYLHPIEIYQRTNQIEKLAGAYEDISLVYDQSGNLDAYEKMTQKLLEFHQRLNKKEEVMGDYTILGALAFDRNDLKKAREYYHHSLQLCKDLNLIKDSAICYQMLGNIAVREGSLDSGRNYFTEADKIAHQLDDKELSILINISLAELEAISGNIESSINRRKQIINWEKKGIKIKNKNLLAMNYLALSLLYVAQGKKSLSSKMASEALKLLGKSHATGKEAKVKIEITAPSLDLIREITGKSAKKEMPALDRFRRELLFPEQTADTEVKKETK